MSKLLLLLVPLVAACAPPTLPLIELQSKDLKRVWFVSGDGKQVWRCYDLADGQPKEDGQPPPTKPRAVCVEAERRLLQ